MFIIHSVHYDFKLFYGVSFQPFGRFGSDAHFLSGFHGGELFKVAELDNELCPGLQLWERLLQVETVKEAEVNGGGFLALPGERVLFPSAQQVNVRALRSPRAHSLAFGTTV